MTTTLFTTFDTLVEEGLLRRLGVAFARFITSIAPTPVPLIVSCALLSELEGRGHSCLKLDELAADPCTMLGWTDEQWHMLQAAAGPLPESVADWTKALAACKQVWVAGDADLSQPLVLDQDRLYLRRYWRHETLVARAVGERAAQQPAVNAERVREWLDRLFEPNEKDQGPDWQKIACAVAVRSTFSIITGGPGTGKTYTVARLLALLFALADDPLRLRIALAAPTGKAAARLKQSIDDALGGLAIKVGDALPLADLTARMPAACTLHSLLGARPDTRALRHHAGNPLEVDVLIVDEASMIHLEMMAALLDALPPTTMVILLGDKDQLASVEAGAVLGDLCFGAEVGSYAEQTAHYVLQASGETMPVEMVTGGDVLAQQTVMLRKSRRFSGPIGVLAHAVNTGNAAVSALCLRSGEDQILQWMEHAQPEKLLQIAINGRPGAEGGYRDYLQLLKQNPLPCDAQMYEAWVHRVLKAFDAFRILCAVREGEWGVAGINQAIEQRIEKEGYIRHRGEWYIGRPVMVTRNDYGIGVFNGDIGITLPDPLRADSLRVFFLHGDAVRSVLATRLANVDTTYAMTVHKVQGSEFLHVVMVLPHEAGPVVARELVYTGITRARERFTLVTPVAAVLEQAIVRKTKRASGLRVLLNG
ncbi:MAG: exodeoxyribonuclease V subunit alpha [Pseudomonadota bacterium]